MKPKAFKLALIQMEVRGGDRAWNTGHAVELIAEAASCGAQVVLLPECMDLGWTHPSSLLLAGEIPDGEVCQALRGAAREHSIYVCSGLTEKSGDRIFNSALPIDRCGQVLSIHRKV